MLRIVLAVLAAFAVLVGALFGVALTRPDTYHVQRELEIAAPAAAVFANLEDFKRWRDWSPWEKLEPGMQRTYAGAERGVGASYTWRGDKVGSGTMTVTQASAPEKLAIELAFVKPFQETNQQTFSLTPTAAGTRVLWSMHGPLRLGGRVMSLFTDMDKIIGRDFETGLTQLKQLCEKPAP
jgi:uncharacterized protein YndB with AHSA1/START domain